MLHVMLICLLWRGICVFFLCLQNPKENHELNTKQRCKTESVMNLQERGSPSLSARETFEEIFTF